MMPGIQPRMVNKMLIKKSAPHPLSRNTPKGGRKMAKRILQISDAVNAMVNDVGENGETEAKRR